MSARHEHQPLHRPTLEMLTRALAYGMDLRPAPDIRGWVESRRIPVLATHNRQAAASGRVWEFSDFPVMADWVFDFIQHPTSRVLFKNGEVREVRNRTAAVLKDAQSGLTSVMIHALAWHIEWRGGNVIMITATRDLARDGGKDKLDLLDQYPELKKSKADNSTAMALRYPRSIVWLGGGQSAGAVISNPSSLNICDEASKHTLVNEMIPMQLLEGRITSDDDGKQISFSTPDNALEHTRNQATGKMEPVITIETAIHHSFLQGTQEVVEVPCPHCGHYQVLDWQRLRFSHCKESLSIPSTPSSPSTGRPIWNRDRVVRETWYQCANPECTDRHPDGAVRGRIDEAAHKRGMIERRRYVAQNLEYRSGHRTLQAGGMYNLAFTDRSWGSIADKFITAAEGGEAGMKSFLTDVIGIPFSRYQLKDDNLEAVRRLRRGYRRISHEGKPTLRIPINTEDIRILGMTADVQRTPGMEAGDIGAVKWLIFAAGKDCQCWVLDWGSVPSLEGLTDLIEIKIFSSKDEPDSHHLTIDVVCIDTGYAKEKVQAFLAGEGGSRSLPRWCGVRGRSRDNDAALRGRARLTREWPARDKFNNPTVIRILNVRADHWEGELHIERVAKEADRDEKGVSKRTAPAINLPSDTDDEFLEELANMEQYYDKPNKGNVRELKWRKRRHDKPNDHADNARNALAVIDAVEEELLTGRAQL